MNLTRNIQTASTKHRIRDEENPRAIVIVCSADDQFTMPLAVTICSAMRNINSESKLLLYVLDGGITRRNKLRLLRSWDLNRITVEWITPDFSNLQGLKVSEHISIVAYYRIIIPMILPTYIHKCIYLDSDMLILGDLWQLWEKDFKGFSLMAVQDMAAPYMNARAVLENYESCAPHLSASVPLIDYKQLGIPSNAKYFNSGLMVVNLKKWRKRCISQAILEYLRKNEESIIWWDQDGLNAVLVDDWLELNHRWNQLTHIYQYPSWKESPFSEELYDWILSDPWVIHFASPSKPWQPDCTHPAVDKFFYYLDMTDWAGWRPQMSSLEDFYKVHIKETMHNDSSNSRIISVIMYNFNGGQYIAETINSVLNQDFGRYELIIVDDGSTDGSRKIIDNFQQRYPEKIRSIYQTYKGQGAAYNDGFAASNGDIVCFLDSKGLWFPNKLMHVHHVFTKHHGFSFHQHNFFVMRNGQISWKKLKDILVTGNCLNHAKNTNALPQFAPLGGLSFQRHVLEKIFPIPEEVKSGADRYLTGTGICYGDVLATNDCLGVYRVLERNQTYQEQRPGKATDIDELLVSALDEYYEKNNIDFRLSQEKLPQEISTLLSMFMKWYRFLIPFKVRLLLWEKIPIYRYLSRAIDL